ncbi:MAG: alpha/beta hydrolase [Faecalicatena sp.]|uniref:alpha/beta hydrolase n=1 Tax=Faecalicatena sp. TaxID=2005360 RepID=UPI0025879209|nr:alpha/beta hydrolase [Faecalicatena sp.]MCI6464176.1 alpha/beta hydrolase [Faecalicatena sp.]MDY5621142.1 alpha/beta hydrolase [Lachnospiraceae bacterium]
MLTEEIKLYPDREDVTLTTYVIAEKGELHAQGNRPAVLICPGGGYFNCSDREAEPVALKFASMGYHAFVLRYSTYDEGKNQFPDLTRQIEPKEKTKHPAPVRDIGKAMLYIREHAKAWSVDMGRVAVCGFSAGAHNSAMYSVYWNSPLLTEFFGVDAEMLRPAAVILGYTLSDYIFMKGVKKNEMDTAFFAASNTAFLGEANPSEEKLREVSPALNVTENTPPTFLWATAADGMVPVQHSLRMAHALADHKVPFEIHIFEEGDHGLSVATQASAMSRTMLNQDAAKWVGLAECWLEKRFALDLPQKTAFEQMMER